MVDGAVFEERQRAQATVNCIGDGAATAGVESVVAYIDLMTKQITGDSSAEPIGRSCSQGLGIPDGSGRTDMSPISTAVTE